MLNSLTTNLVKGHPHDFGTSSHRGFSTRARSLNWRIMCSSKWKLNLCLYCNIQTTIHTNPPFFCCSLPQILLDFDKEPPQMPRSRESAKALADALRVKTSLSHLDLARNELRQRGAEAVHSDGGRAGLMVEILKHFFTRIFDENNVLNSKKS